MKRREFLSAAAAAALGARTVYATQSTDARREELLKTEQSSKDAATRIPRVTSAGTLKGEMLYRELGATGVQVSLIGMGGAHLGRVPLEEDEAIRLIHEGLDRGINFLDNSWDYNEGRSEERVGKALAQGGYRQKAFVMTKLDGRTKEVATNQINDSLRRLRVDHIDLLQHHEIIRFDDPDRIFNEGGGMEAVLEAKQAGKVRFIGFTGHKDPRVHLYMLEVAQKHGFHFDTVQMPLNVMDAHFRSFGHEVLPVLVREGIAPLGMKCFGDHFILDSNTIKPVEGLHYCLNLPIAVQITGLDSPQVLDQAFEATRTFRPMTAAQVDALLERTRTAALAGKYELYKTTSHFDGTAHKPEDLG
jgi:diketogulonate reductase-like aldo/keto reductase